MKPAEILEIIAHLAFHSGWANATAANAIAKRIFDKRGIRPDQLPSDRAMQLTLDEA